MGLVGWVFSWVKYGTIEQSAADAIKLVQSHPEWLDLSDKCSPNPQPLARLPCGSRTACHAHTAAAPSTARRSGSGSKLLPSYGYSALAQRRLCGSALKSARLCGALSRAVTAVTGDGQYSLVASRIRSYALTGFHTVDHSIRSLVRYFVLLGATSAMGPLDILLAHGTTCGSAHAHTTLGRHAPCCAGVS